MGTVLLVCGGVAFLVLLAVAGWAIGIYNRLVELRNRTKNAWAQIDVQLKRRFDLVPNLVETVRGYAAHERETFEAVTAARTAGMNAKTHGESAEADNMLTGALKSLFAVAESYPDLKASSSFLNLQKELSETEDKISYVRRAYNDAVMAYNTTIQRFPAVLIAGMLGFRAEDLFNAPEDATEPVAVRF